MQKWWESSKSYSSVHHPPGPTSTGSTGTGNLHLKTEQAQSIPIDGKGIPSTDTTGIVYNTEPQALPHTHSIESLPMSSRNLHFITSTSGNSYSAEVRKPLL